MQIETPERCTYREVFGDILLNEADISSVSRAFALLVHLVLIAVELLGCDSGFLGLQVSGVGLILEKYRYY